MKRFLYKHWIEMAAVSALLLVLLVAVTPRFQDAQLRTQISRAQLALGAMCDYVRDVRMLVIQPGGVAIPDVRGLRITEDRNNQYRVGILYTDEFQNTKHIASHVHDDFPVFPLATEESAPEFCRYELSIGTTMPLGKRLLNHHLIAAGKSTMLAYVIGPRAHDGFFQNYEPNHATENQLALYDASNGLLSHGWLLYVRDGVSETLP